MRTMMKTAVIFCLLILACGLAPSFAEETKPSGFGGFEGFVGAAPATAAAPIAGASVDLLVETSTVPVASTKTDEKGLFKFAEIASGYYKAKISAEGYRTFVEIVHIQPGIVLKREYFLNPVSNIEKGILKGIVTEDVGMLTIVPPPIYKALILVYVAQMGNDGLYYPAPTPIREARTSETGYYEIPELPYGPYIVTAQALNYEKGEALVKISAPEFVQNFSLKKFQPKGVIFGKVVQDVGNLDIVPPPIAKAGIKVFQCWITAAGAINWNPNPIAETETEENGDYKVPELAFGYYRVVVNAEEYQEAAAFVKLFAPEFMQNFQLKKIIATPTPTQTPAPVEKGTLFGKVVENAVTIAIYPPVPLKPIPDAHVLVFKTWVYPKGEGTTNVVPVAEAWTDADGMYKIPELPFGYYHVKVEAKGYFPAGANLRMAAPEVELNFFLNINEPTPTATPTPTPILPGHIFGIVLGEDENSTEPYPLAKAIVEVYPQIECVNFAECAFPPIARAITDENGNYRIGKIPAGLWIVKASREGYLPQFEPLEMKPQAEVEVNFLLKAGEAPKPGVIFGVVMGLRPDPAMEAGSPIAAAPIAGAKVEVFLAPVYTKTGDIEPSQGAPIATAITNENGEYKIDNLETGVYLVKASARGFYPQHKKAEVLSRPLQLNFELKPFIQPTPTPTASIIRGRVFEASPTASREPAPIEGAQVKIMGENGDPIILFTDADGKYEATDLKAGAYKMEASAEGYNPQFRHLYLGVNEIKIVHFALVPKPEPTPVPEPGALFGVVFAMVPRQADSPTSPIEGAIISVFPMDAQTNTGWIERKPIAQAKTDEKGQYIIEEIPAGPYMVVAEAAGFVRAMRNVFIPPAQKIRLNFGLRPDEMPQPTPVPFGKIVGRVLGVNPNGMPEPLEGAEVLLFPAAVLPMEKIPAPIRQVLTDAEGRFVMEEIPAGHYLAMAKMPGFEPASQPAPVYAGRVTEIIFKLRPEISPTPTPEPGFGSIEGKVAYEKDGIQIGIPSAQMIAFRLNNTAREMMDARPAQRTATDENGYYKFAELAPGRYAVLARVEGFEPGHAPADVKASETTILDFILQIADEPTTKVGTLFGKVMTMDIPTTVGARPVIRPLEGADILVYDARENLQDEESLVPAGRAISDQSGLFVVDNLPFGAYIVIAKKEGFTPQIRKALIRSMTETRVSFMLLPVNVVKPNDETGSVYEWGDGEGWNPAGAPDFFRMPDAFRENRRLKLRCHDNTNTFGYWFSPKDAIPVEAGTIYKSTFSLTSTIEDPTKVPCIRVRFNRQNEQMADIVVINSRGDAAMSPGPAGKIYTFFFSLPQTDVALPEDENDIYVSFDIVNFDDTDAEEAEVSLDWINIDAVPEDQIPEGTEVASYDFSEGNAGWHTESAPIFTAAEFQSKTCLGMKARNNKNTYSAWVSPVDMIPIAADTIYTIKWTLFSDQTDKSIVPGIRLRAGEDGQRFIVAKFIFSNTEGDESPDCMGSEFKQFYYAAPELVGSNLYIGFDMVNFNEADSPDATVGLKGVKIMAIPISEMP